MRQLNCKHPVRLHALRLHTSLKADMLLLQANVDIFSSRRRLPLERPALKSSRCLNSTCLGTRCAGQAGAHFMWHAHREH
jgi:hypothetical protein